MSGGRFDYLKEIDKLKESKDYGVSRIEQLQEERRQAEQAEARRHRRVDNDDDDDFIDNTGEDLVKNMRKVKIEQAPEAFEEELADIDGPIAQGFRNTKVV